MSKAQAIVQYVERTGGRMYVGPDGELKLKTRQPMPPDMLSRLKQHRGDLLALLSPAPVVIPATPRDAALDYADREIDRFVNRAVETADGGLRDPSANRDIITSVRAARPWGLPDVRGAPDGWTRAGWIVELLRMARACADVDPAKSSEYMAEAAALVLGRPIGGPDDLDADWRIVYEERAAIREHDGNMARDVAEREALADVVAAMAGRHDPSAT